MRVDGKVFIESKTPGATGKNMSASDWQVLDKDGNHVGDIIRQPGSTLWCLQRKGMNRPFKRNIPTLDAAKKLTVDHPEIWRGPNFDLRSAAIHFGLWVAFLAGLLVLFLFV